MEKVKWSKVYDGDETKGINIFNGDRGFVFIDSETFIKMSHNLEKESHHLAKKEKLERDIISFLDSVMGCYATKRELARKTRATRSEMDIVLKKLVDENIITEDELENRGARSSIIYRLV